MKTHLVVAVLAGIVAGLTGCYLDEGYGGHVVVRGHIQPRVVVEQPPDVIEQPDVVFDEPGIIVQPGIIFNVPIVVWDDDARREIIIDRRDWDHWRLDRDGRHIDEHGHHFHYRRDAKFHRHDGVKPHLEKEKKIVVHRELNKDNDQQSHTLVHRENLITEHKPVETKKVTTSHKALVVNKDIHKVTTAHMAGDENKVIEKVTTGHMAGDENKDKNKTPDQN